jgi:NAD(P)-dependent dehydrogenase (short-subunit alcohol dehydrogenase family)
MSKAAVKSLGSIALPLLTNGAVISIGSLAAVVGISLAITAAIRRSGKQPGSPRVVVVTGGSRGFGFAIAERFARSGDLLVLASRKQDELEQARAKLVASKAVASAEDVLLVAGDLTDQNAAQELIDRTLARFGHIDVLINNAGIIQVGPVENQTIDAYRNAMETNYFAALYCVQAAMPHMLRQAGERKAARRRIQRVAKPAGPVIVNIASIGGKMAVPHMLPYTASKFALVGFSEGLHAELRSKGVHVVTVCPGLMRTGGEDHAHFIGDVPQEKRWFHFAAKTPGVTTTPEHAASRVFHAVASRRTEITITPQAYLAARAVGLSPTAVQFANALANEYLLPKPLPQ